MPVVPMGLDLLDYLVQNTSDEANVFSLSDPMIQLVTQVAEMGKVGEKLDIDFVYLLETISMTMDSLANMTLRLKNHYIHQYLHSKEPAKATVPVPKKGGSVKYGTNKVGDGGAQGKPSKSIEIPEDVEVN